MTQEDKELLLNDLCARLPYELMTDDCMERGAYNEACEAAIKYCLENLI